MSDTPRRRRSFVPQILGVLALIGGGLIYWATGDGRDDEDIVIDTKPFAGLTLRVSVPDQEDLLSQWKIVVNEWCVPNEATFELNSYPIDSPKPIAEESTPDLFFVDWSQVPELAARDQLAELPGGLEKEFGWPDVFVGLRSRAATLGRKPRVVPVSCPTLVCYYRKDLLDEANLEPPQTWTEYQKLLETRNDWAKGLPVVEPWGEDFRASWFLARTAAFAKHPEQLSYCFEMGSAEPLITHPGFVEGLKQAKAALALMPADVRNYTPEDCRREILTGKAAIAIAFESQTPAKVERPDELEVGFCPLPGTRRTFNTAINEWVDLEPGTIHAVTYTGFEGWAIGVHLAEDARQTDAAWQLARYLCTEKMGTTFPAEFLSLCRESQISDVDRWVGGQLSAAEARGYLTTVRDALRNDQLVMELPLVGQKKFRAALTQGLGIAIEQSGNEKESLEAIAGDWRKILQELGADKVAKSYRLSLF